VLAPDSGWNGPFDATHDAVPVFFAAGATETARRYAFFFGQSLFTPKILTLEPPDPHDRPYAGWI
jgi:hypothetical protein